MDINKIIRDNTGINAESVAETFIQRRIRRFKENIIFNLIFYGITIVVLLSVGVYLFVVIAKAVR